MQKKLERLLRYHRQRVFDEQTGDAHGRAIARLKRTQTFRKMCRDNQERAAIRRGEQFTRMGY